MDRDAGHARQRSPLIDLALRGAPLRPRADRAKHFFDFCQKVPSRRGHREIGTLSFSSSSISGSSVPGGTRFGWSADMEDPNPILGIILGSNFRLRSSDQWREIASDDNARNPCRTRIFATMANDDERWRMMAARNLAIPAGLEPATRGVEIRYSIQLSYGTVRVGQSRRTHRS
jgi:hypothetical protein